MISIGATDFYFAAPSLSKQQLEKYSLQLFDSWESSVERNLLLPDYSLSLEVEEGSIKGKGKIAAGLAAVYVGISSYGSFISGLQIVRDQIITVSDILTETAEQKLGSDYHAPKVRKRSETLGALERLFEKVQRGQMTPAEASKEAEALIGDDAQDSPQFMSHLANSLAQAPRFHEQISLPLEHIEEQVFRPLGLDEFYPNNIPEKNLPPRRPHAPIRPNPSHVRVEVWRESKKQKRNFRTVNV